MTLLFSVVLIISFLRQTPLYDSNFETIYSSSSHNNFAHVYAIFASNRICSPGIFSSNSLKKTFCHFSSTKYSSKTQTCLLFLSASFLELGQFPLRIMNHFVWSCNERKALI